MRFCSWLRNWWQRWWTRLPGAATAFSGTAWTCLESTGGSQKAEVDREEDWKRRREEEKEDARKRGNMGRGVSTSRAHTSLTWLGARRQKLSIRVVPVHIIEAVVKGKPAKFVCAGMECDFHPTWSLT